MIAQSANRFPDATTPHASFFRFSRAARYLFPVIASAKQSRSGAAPWIASAASPPRNDGPSFPVIASASEASAKQSRSGAATRYAARPSHAAPPPGLLRRLRRLAMTVDMAVPSPPAHDSRHGRPPSLRARAQARAKQSRIGQGNTHPPRNDGHLGNDRHTWAASRGAALP